MFCGVYKISGSDMELQKFDDLDYTTPVDWSGKLVSKSKKYAIPGIGQKNYIKHDVADNVDVLHKGGSVDCNNENINYSVDLIQLRDKLFPYKDTNPNYSAPSSDPLLVPNLPARVVARPNLPGDPTNEPVKGLKDLVILVESAEYLGASGGSPLSVQASAYRDSDWSEIFQADTTTITSNAQTYLTEFYDPTGNYALMATMLTDPVIYEAELNLNIIDVFSFDHFKAVKIDELEGIFYVNKISNFLITSPGTPTKVELIKIS